MLLGVFGRCRSLHIMGYSGDVVMLKVVGVCCLSPVLFCNSFEWCTTNDRVYLSCPVSHGMAGPRVYRISDLTNRDRFNGRPKITEIQKASRILAVCGYFEDVALYGSW